MNTSNDSNRIVINETNLQQVTRLHEFALKVIEGAYDRLRADRSAVNAFTLTRAVCPKLDTEGVDPLTTERLIRKILRERGELIAVRKAALAMTSYNATTPNANILTDAMDRRDVYERPGFWMETFTPFAALTQTELAVHRGRSHSTDQTTSLQNAMWKLLVQVFGGHPPFGTERYMADAEFIGAIYDRRLIGSLLKPVEVARPIGGGTLPELPRRAFRCQLSTLSVLFEGETQRWDFPAALDARFGIGDRELCWHLARITTRCALLDAWDVYEHAKETAERAGAIVVHADLAASAVDKSEARSKLGSILRDLNYTWFKLAKTEAV